MATLQPFPYSADPTDAGGAYVRRAFGRYKAGDELTREEVASIPLANLQALVNTKHLQLWPAGPSEVFIPERFLVPVENNKCLIIEGRRVTKKPVSPQYARRLMAKG